MKKEDTKMELLGKVRIFSHLLCLTFVRLSHPYPYGHSVS